MNSDHTPKKEIEVQITYSWKFNSDEWQEYKEHIEKCKEHMQIVLSYDPISAFYSLNDITYPNAKFNVI